MLDQSILTKGMRRWFLFIAITSTFLVANGFYLWFFESRAVSDNYILSYYYIGNVLAHLVIGLLFGIPFAGFVLSHLRVTWRHRNKRARQYRACVNGCGGSLARNRHLPDDCRRSARQLLDPHRSFCRRHGGGAFVFTAQVGKFSCEETHAREPEGSGRRHCGLYPAGRRAFHQPERFRP